LGSTGIAGNFWRPEIEAFLTANFQTIYPGKNVGTPLLRLNEVFSRENLVGQGLSLFLRGKTLVKLWGLHHNWCHLHILGAPIYFTCGPRNNVFFMCAPKHVGFYENGRPGSSNPVIQTYSRGFYSNAAKICAPIKFSNSPPGFYRWGQQYWA